MVDPKLTLLEKRFAKPAVVKLEAQDNQEYDVGVDWNLIDGATSNYTEMLKEFDFAKIIKSMITRYGRENVIHVLPMAGNIDFSDSLLGFDSFYAFLEDSRKTLLCFSNKMGHLGPIATLE